MTRRPGLAGRLLTAQLLVISAGAVTFALVALAAGPPLFRIHLREALGTVPPALARHLEDAFATAAGIAIGVATAASVLTAAAVSLLIARRFARPIHALDTAATRLAGGDYTTRMPPAGLGPEIDTLTAAFNTMAAALETTEATRRRMLADAAHELRTPLATLDAYLEGLADGVRAPTQDTWDILGAQTARLRRLADDIALVSRAEEHQLPLHPVPVALNQLVTTAVSAARPGYDAKGVGLTTRLAGHLPELAADPDRLAQVLAGLLSNALRHTPAGGLVTVGTQPAGQAVQITVADTGEGHRPRASAAHLRTLPPRRYRPRPGPRRIRDRADHRPGTHHRPRRHAHRRQQRPRHRRTLHHHAAGLARQELTDSYAARATWPDLACHAKPEAPGRIEPASSERHDSARVLSSLARQCRRQQDIAAVLLGGSYRDR